MFISAGIFSRLPYKRTSGAHFMYRLLLIHISRVTFEKSLFGFLTKFLAHFLGLGWGWGRGGVKVFLSTAFQKVKVKSWESTLIQLMTENNRREMFIYHKICFPVQLILFVFVSFSLFHNINSVFCQFLQFQYLYAKKTQFNLQYHLVRPVHVKSHQNDIKIDTLTWKAKVRSKLTKAAVNFELWKVTKVCKRSNINSYNNSNINNNNNININININNNNNSQREKLVTTILQENCSNQTEDPRLQFAMR